MSAIAATNSSDSNALLSLLRSGAAAGAEATSPASDKTDGASRSGDGPAVVVDLSDHAKATLARAKTEQAAADKLAAQLQAARDPDSKGKAAKADSSDGSQLFDKLSGRVQSQQTGGATWEAGSIYGDPTKSDAQFLAGINDTLLATADNYDRQGFAPDVGQALRNAVANGALKIQKASDVPDLNMQSTQIYLPNPFGGGPGMWGSVSQNPTGATKDAIDRGNALAMWTADRGDVYISW